MIVRAHDRDDERTGPDQDRGPRCARALPGWGRVVALGLALVALAGCGAKTGPRVPCEIALERRPPPVLIVTSHAAGMDEHDPDRPTYWETARATIGRLAPALEDLAPLGALPFPYPERDWRLRSSAQCVADSGYLVAPAPHNATAVLSAHDALGEPAAGSPVYDAFGLAAAALRSAPGGRDRGGIIIFITGGGINCNLTLTPATCDCPQLVGTGPCIDMNGESINCVDRVRTATRVAELRAEGIMTAVLGIDTHTRSNYLPIQVANLEALAAAGGLERPGGRGYYRAADPAEVAQVLDAVLPPLLHCALRGDLRGHDPEGVVLQDATGVTIARDAARRDGWDWTDAARGELAVFGPACDRVARVRGAVHLVTTESRCLP